MKRTAIVFLSYFLDDELIFRLNRLQEQASNFGEIFFFFDESGTVKINDLPAGINTLRFDKRQWTNFKKPTQFHPSFIPGNSDYQFISFRQQKPEYDFYWFMEYDVDFSGDWRDFFQYFLDSNEDFLSTTIHTYEDAPNWNLWKSLIPPPGILLSPNNMIRAFIPIVRFSGRAIDTWRESAVAGWRGHSETALPSALAHAGLQFRDIGGNGRFVHQGDVDRFYRNTPSNNDLGPGTFIFRPSFPRVGDEAGLLWHPVKGKGSVEWDQSKPIVPSVFAKTCSHGKRLITAFKNRAKSLF